MNIKVLGSKKTLWKTFRVFIELSWRVSLTIICIERCYSP